MAKSLDFTKRKKSYFNVTLDDGKNTVLMIATPKKEVFEELIAVKDEIGNANDSLEVMDQLYDICAKIMSNNKGGIKITNQDVAKMFDYEDINVFITAYTEFIQEVIDSKN